MGVDCRRPRDVGALLASPAQAKTLRFAFQGELKSVDPYQIAESLSLSVNGSVYEGLIRRGPDLKIEPCLAESWEVLDPLHWRFHLRKGVKFHEGQDFTADDVIFSAHRVLSAGSDLKGVIPADAEIVKVDDYTVDFLLKSPAPLLINQWETWGIFSKSWSEAHGATEATAMNATTPPYAGLHANGTGPFMLVSHEPGVKTVWKKNPNWWDKPIGNVDEVVFTPIPNAATRVAALLSGEIDWMDPVPLNDQARVGANPGNSGARRTGGADHLPRHGPVSRRTRPFQRQGQEPFQGRPRSQGVLSGDRRGRDQQEGHARPGDAFGADDRASLFSRVKGLPAACRSIPTRRRSCSPRPAIPTASRCSWIARTIATSTTSRSARRWSACSRGSGSRSI